MRGSSGRPMAALVVAGLAAVVATTGTAYAATKVNGKDIAKRSIAGNRLKDNTLTGRQIRESTLGTVPASKTARSAETATSAATAAVANTAHSINGTDVRTFAFTVAENAAFQTVNVSGGAITADCADGTVNLDVTGASDSGESYVVEGGDVTGGPFQHGDAALTTSDFDPLSPATPTSGAGLAVITRGTGSVTTIQFSYRGNADNSCTYNGSVIS